MLPAHTATASKSRHLSGSPARMSEDAKIWVEWKKQLTAYVAWVNSQLKKKPGAHMVEDLRHDVRDGVALIDLIEVIAGERLSDVHAAPSTYAEMRENVDKVLQFMSLKKIKMHHITTRDIVEGNLKAIMRLILALAAHYKPNSVRHSAQSTKQNITGLAQGAAAALTEARRNATRAGHRYRRRRQREENTEGQYSDSDHSQSLSTPGYHHQKKSGGMSRTHQLSHHQRHHHHHNQQHYRHHRDSRTQGENDGLGMRMGEVGGRAELEGASASSSPVSSQNASPRTSLYMSDPPSSMEGLLSVSSAGYKGMMLTSCESDNAMGDSGYSEIVDSLQETHQALFQLHELLLNGDNTDSSRLEIGTDLEGSNPKETIIILKGRLLHAEELAESLRCDLTKVKKDCLELQGVRGGLQQRLKEQDGHLSAMKSSAMNLELEKEQMISEIEALKKQLGDKEQILSDVKTSYVKQVEDKDKVIGDLRRELLKRDHSINALQEQISHMEKQGAAGAKQSKDESRGSAAGQGSDLSSQDQRMSVLIDSLNKLTEQDKSPSLKISEFEMFKDNIQRARSPVPTQDKHLSLIDSLEDSIVKVLDRLHVNGSGVGVSTTGAASQQSKSRPGTSSVKRTPNTGPNWRQTGNRDVAKVSQKGKGQNVSPGRGSPPTRGSQTPSHTASRNQQISPRGPATTHSINRTTPAKPGPRSQIPRPHGPGGKTKSQSPTIAEAETTVLYYTEQSDKPSTCLIRKKLGEIRLRDFKSVIEDSNLYHYFFKALDPEYGTVKEELCNDDDIVPGWEGKIVAWLEEENGTVC